MAINHQGRQRSGPMGAIVFTGELLSTYIEAILPSLCPANLDQNVRAHEIKYPYSIRAVCAIGYCRMGESGVSLAFTPSVDTVCFVDAISLKTDRQGER